MNRRLARYAAKRLGFAVLMLVGLSLVLFHVTRTAYEGFVPIPTSGEVYQPLKAVRWTGR